MPLIQLSFASKESTLSVRRCAVHDAISSPFGISVWARSPNADLDLESLVGQPAALEIAAAGGAPRVWSGVCRFIEQIDVELTGLSTYYLALAPSLWLLDQRRNHRMFQHLAIPDIADKLLGEWGIAPTWKIDRGAYPKLEYKVQYGESDYAFLVRIVEEAGIAFTFADGAHPTFGDRLHVGDARPAPLLFVDSPAQVTDRDFVTQVRLTREVRPGALAIRDYDFRRPRYALGATAPKAAAPEDHLEQYRYQPGAFLVETSGGGETPFADDQGVARNDEKYGRDLAERTLLGEREAKRALTFETNALDLAPASIISIQGHAHSGVGDATRLLVTEMTIDGTPDGDFHVVGRAVFADTPYRPPPRARRPKIRSVQIAAVTGPAGEEIHTDEFGRVRVQFPWDREGKSDDHSSCWMRVSQGWAGASYGTMLLPRVGQEVLVSFLDGDPDRPVIVGRMFNRMRPAPCILPRDAAIQAWKSDSSPGHNGYNEVSLADPAGGELVSIQAQKNLRELVKHDETITIGGNRNKEVKHDEIETITLDRTQCTGEKRTQTTGADRVIAISGDSRAHVGGSATERVEGHHVVLVGHDLHLVIKQTRRELVEVESHQRVKGSRSDLTENMHSVLVLGDHHEKSGGDSVLSVDKELHLKAGAAAVGEAMDVTLAGPGGFIRIDASGVTIVGSAVRINCSGGSAGDGKDAKPSEAELAREAARTAPAELSLLPVPMDKTAYADERKLFESPGWKSTFPNLGSDFEVLGPSTPNYNCIAHTLGDHAQWVNPETGPKNDPLSKMDAKYAALGYKRSSNTNTAVEPGKEKIVVYATKNSDGSIKEVTHGAVQQPDGTYTSKLGQGPLIRHPTPEALNGPVYGEPVGVYEKGP